jgi:signal transduction histidine kinase
MIIVLVNLITNAIKFTAKKDGERSISVSMGASTERPTSYPPNVIFFGQDQVGYDAEDYVDMNDKFADVSIKEQFHIDSTISSDWGTGTPLYLMVAVKDTGIGIGKDDQVKLFERFRCATSSCDCFTDMSLTRCRQATPKTQENYGGSGLGLFISRKRTLKSLARRNTLIMHSLPAARR